MTLNEIMQISYKDFGRDERGVDCWGFVRLVRHYHHKKPLLTSFGNVAPDDKNEMTKSYHQLANNFTVTQPVDSAIACHFIKNILVHVGVVIEENGLLKVAHTSRKTKKPMLTRIAEFERMALVTRYYIDVDIVFLSK